MERTLAQLKALLRECYLETADEDGCSVEGAIRIAVKYHGVPEQVAADLMDDVADELFREAYNEHAWMRSYVREAIALEREGDYEGAEAIKKLIC